VRKQTRKNYYRNSPERRRQRIIRRFVVSVKIVCLLACMGGASLFFILVHDALTQSSYFKAREIIVEGNRRLTTEAILKQAAVKPGDNVLGINLRILRYRLLANPWIAAADVWRELPDTIHIRVVERVPVAKVEVDGTFYLDDRGELVEPAGSSDDISVPLVTGLTLADMGPHSQPPSRVFGAVMEVLHLSQLDGSVLPIHMLRRIQADPDTGLTLFGFDCNLGVKLGFGEYNSKFNRLRDLISYFRQDDGVLNIEYIDLKDVDRVVVRPSRGMSAQKVCYRKGV
jgi:cell division protein FtsQ